MVRHRTTPKPEPVASVAIAGDPSALPADQEEGVAPDPGIPTSILRMDQRAVEVATPYVGQAYVCPRCRREIPVENLITLGKPPEFAHLLNTIHRCPYCRLLFSYRSRAVVVRA